MSLTKVTQEVFNSEIRPMLENKGLTLHVDCYECNTLFDVIDAVFDEDTFGLYLCPSCAFKVADQNLRIAVTNELGFTEADRIAKSNKWLKRSEYLIDEFDANVSGLETEQIVELRKLVKYAENVISGEKNKECTECVELQDELRKEMSKNGDLCSFIDGDLDCIKKQFASLVEVIETIEHNILK